MVENGYAHWQDDITANVGLQVINNVRPARHYRCTCLEKSEPRTKLHHDDIVMMYPSSAPLIEMISTLSGGSGFETP